ncbi:Predicted metal-dependent hydrolase, TIM-barrel fold [Hyunsoonleella jejuensis]|uniref:Predicted metal-dependent hydrolase, TIM-barrel fold n=1 Tax=Hyunsoonleella jejuensis TaxID=419940 RepID=A0A1H9IRP2_9FLAO|nr:amidohydrolase family protein [Hyunsoonleella jejuensis]SEQ77250.1 Predicted metal-dependent hydrolase, TIM-barrel fold [Hyunsoonleella jejuensis]
MTFNLKVYVIFLSLLAFVLSALGQNNTARIDAHIHLYDINRDSSFTFLNKQNKDTNPELFRPHLEKDFLEVANSSGINYAYLVEASTRREDNFWLSQIASESKHILGFTVNLNPLDANFKSDLDTLKKNTKFRGVRPRYKGLDFSNAEVFKQLKELDKRNLVLEINGLKHVATIAKQYPNMPIVVNHFGGVKLKNGVLQNEENYKKALQEVASFPNVFMKISALHTLSGKNPAPKKLKYYKPLLDANLEAFGPNRVLFGSNWPLSGLRGKYNNAIQILEAYCSTRNDLSEEQLFFNNIIKAYGLTNPTIPTFMELSNDELRLKLDLRRGGAIAYISKSDIDRNIVNIHDEGRYIQQSYYGGNIINRQQEGQKKAWSPWSWNPIQVGDCYRNRAEILEYKQEGHTLYVKCIPMLWDMKNKPAEAIMEQWTTLEGNVIKVQNKLTCHRTDTIYGEGKTHNQELPAVYPISALNNLYSYFGDKPFTGAPLSKPKVVNLRSGFWGKYKNNMVTENWMAFVNDDLWGMGVYTPTCSNFLAGMAKDPGYEAYDSATSYIAPINKATLNKDTVYEFDYYLIIGNLRVIREDVYDLNKLIKSK